MKAQEVRRRRESGELCKLPPAGSGAQPWPTTNFVHFGSGKNDAGGTSNATLALSWTAGRS